MKTKFVILINLLIICFSLNAQEEHYIDTNKLFFPNKYFIDTLHSQTESQIIKNSVYIECTQCDSLYNEICPDNNRIFGGPEHYARFPGGEKELTIFLRNNIQYPIGC